jgi:hypothetical protein
MQTASPLAESQVPKSPLRFCRLLCYLLKLFAEGRKIRDSLYSATTYFDIIISLGRPYRFSDAHLVVNVLLNVAPYSLVIAYVYQRGGAVGLGTVLQAGRSRVRFPMVSLEFFIYIIL